jgi:dipeptidyl aminopeptidase/acylaminoacyl peptidase
MSRTPGFVLRQAVLMVSVCSLGLASAADRDGLLLERIPYRFPPYRASNETEGLFSREAYERALSDPGFEFQKLKYLSDGLKVVAYLYKPRQTEGTRLPVIIYNRGNYLTGDQAPLFLPLFHRLASRGFVILAPQYRESDGGEGKDEVGGADLNDLMNLVPLASSLEFIDMRNVFMYGESRGGMMTYQAIRERFPLNAAAVIGAFTDLEGLIKHRPQVYGPLIARLFPDYEQRKTEIVRRRSAIQWAEKLNVPLLVMHGGADWSVDPAQSLDLARKLQKLGKSYELVIYAGDGHILLRNEEDRDRRALAWFERHLKR